MKFKLGCLVMLLASIGYSQESFTTKTTHSLGLHLGTTTGTGFSYRYWPNKIGLQVTTIPIFNGNKNNYVSAGLSGLYLIKEHNRLNVFGYLGTHYIYRTYLQTFPTGTFNMYGYPNYEERIVAENIINIGFGFGTTINILPELSLSLQTGYGFYDISENLNGNLSGEIGLYYHLK